MKTMYITNMLSSRTANHLFQSQLPDKFNYKIRLALGLTYLFVEIKVKYDFVWWS